MLAGCTLSLGDAADDQKCDSLRAAADLPVSAVVPSVVPQLPPLPDLEVLGHGRVEPVRTGDQHDPDTGLAPQIRLPGVLVLQTSDDDAKIRDVVRAARRQVQQDGGTPGQTLKATIGNEEQILGFEWTLDATTGSTVAYACGPVLLQTVADGRPDTTGPCSPASVRPFCQRIYDALAPLASHGGLELLKGDGNGSQAQFATDQDLTFAASPEAITATLTHTFDTSSDFFAISSLRDAFAVQGWTRVSETCGGSPCTEVGSGPYRASYNKDGVTVTATIPKTAPQRDPRVSLTASTPRP